MGGGSVHERIGGTGSGSRVVGISAIHEQIDGAESGSSRMVGTSSTNERTGGVATGSSRYLTTGALNERMESRESSTSRMMGTSTSGKGRQQETRTEMRTSIKSYGSGTNRFASGSQTAAAYEVNDDPTIF